MSRVFNIDEKLAARVETTKEPVTVTFRGRDWEFVPSMPADLPELATNNKLIPAIYLCVVPEQRDDFRDLAISVPEAAALIEAIGAMYGVTSGES
jgi:hypothetical protein